MPFVRKWPALVAIPNLPHSHPQLMQYWHYWYHQYLYYQYWHHQYWCHQCWYYCITYITCTTSVLCSSTGVTCTVCHDELTTVVLSTSDAGTGKSGPLVPLVIVHHYYHLYLYYCSTGTTCTSGTTSNGTCRSDNPVALVPLVFVLLQYRHYLYFWYYWLHAEHHCCVFKSGNVGIKLISREVQKNIFAIFCQNVLQKMSQCECEPEVSNFLSTFCADSFDRNLR